MGSKIGRKQFKLTENQAQGKEILWQIETMYVIEGNNELLKMWGPGELCVSAPGAPGRERNEVWDFQQRRGEGRLRRSGLLNARREVGMGTGWGGSANYTHRRPIPVNKGRGSTRHARDDRRGCFDSERRTRKPEGVLGDQKVYRCR